MGVPGGRSQRSSIVRGGSTTSKGKSSSSQEFESALPAYRDFARESTESIVKAVEPPKAKRKGPRGGVTTPFPNRLFDMLEASENEGFEHVVSWQSHGRSFMVRKPTIFETKILPQFFAQTKMSSFQRQLNLYGFLRQNTGRDRGSYYHELFLRSRPDLPKIMLRTRVKGIGMGRTNRVDKEPDFYKMPPCLPKVPSSSGKGGRGPNTIAGAESSNNVAPTPIPSTPAEEPREIVTSPLHDLEEEQEEDVEPCVAQSDYSMSQPQPRQRHQYHHQAYHHHQVSSRPSSSSAAWISRPARVSPSYVSVVSPEDTGRPLFLPSRTCDGNYMGMGVDGRFPHPGRVPRSDNLPPHGGDICSTFDDYPFHHTACQPSAIWNSCSSASFPVIPAVYPDPISLPTIPYLQPRYTTAGGVAAPNSSISSCDRDLEDTALFEGLEFQIVDDDSLEQFESDLMPEPTTSVSSTSGL